MWRCRGCGQVLGLTIGQTLIIGMLVAVDRETRMQCRACGLWQTWYPPRSANRRKMPLITLGGEVDRLE